ncbi:unnamed protein product, partial [Prorocentrum cordatum]
DAAPAPAIGTQDEATLPDALPRPTFSEATLPDALPPPTFSDATLPDALPPPTASQLQSMVDAAALAVHGAGSQPPSAVASEEQATQPAGPPIANGDSGDTLDQQHETPAMDMELEESLGSLESLSTEICREAAEATKATQAISKLIQGLEASIKNGVPARTPEYSQFCRALDEDEDLQNRYSACQGRTSKAAFREDWAKKKVQVLNEKVSQKQVSSEIDWQHTHMRSLAQIADKEKDQQVALNIAKTCVKLGPPFIKWDPSGKVWRFAHAEEGFTEKLEKAWQVKQDLESDGSPMKPAGGGGGGEGPPPKKPRKDKGKSKDTTSAPEPPIENSNPEDVSKVQLQQADKDCKDILDMYRTATSKASSIIEVINKNDEEWKWLQKDSPLATNLQKSYDTSKTSAPGILKSLLFGKTIAKVKKDLGKKQYVAEATSMRTTMSPLLQKLATEADGLNTMHANRPRD